MLERLTFLQAASATALLGGLPLPEAAAPVANLHAYLKQPLAAFDAYLRSQGASIGGGSLGVGQ